MSIPSRHAPLPEGEEKVAAVRAMFDAIAPRYDLVNRVMTFRMDVGWRRRTVGELALPSGSIVLDLARGRATCAASWHDRGLEAISVDLSEGMLRADRSGVPRVLADVLQLPSATAPPTAPRAGSRCATSRLAVVLRRARSRRAGRRAIALLEVATPHNPVMRWGHGIYFGHVVPVIGGWLSDGDAYRYLPRSVAYLPEPDCARRHVPCGGVPRRAADDVVGGHRPAAHGHAPMIARTVRLDADVDLLAVAGADGFLFEEHGAGLAGRGVAARLPLIEAADALAAIHVEDEVGLPGCGPVAFGSLPFSGTDRGEVVVPELVVGRHERRRTLDHDHRRARRPDAADRSRCSDGPPGLGG